MEDQKTRNEVNVKGKYGNKKVKDSKSNTNWEMWRVKSTFTKGCHQLQVGPQAGCCQNMQTAMIYSKWME